MSHRWPEKQLADKTSPRVILQGSMEPLRFRYIVLEYDIAWHSLSSSISTIKSEIYFILHFYSLDDNFNKRILQLKDEEDILCYKVDGILPIVCSSVV